MKESSSEVLGADHNDVDDDPDDEYKSLVHQNHIHVP